MAKLGELYKITSGGTPSRNHSEYFENGTIPWVKTGDLKDKYLFETDEKISQLGLENSSARIYLKNTVLLAMYGATIGATSILEIDAATNQACAAFSPREDVLPEYLYAFLESQKDKFIKDAVGGAQPNLSAGYLKNIDFDYPPLEQQTKITNTLNKIDELLLLRKQQLSKLDELVKARFVEMFGDPIRNDKHFVQKTGKSLFCFSSGKFLQEEKRFQHGFPVYGGNGITWYTDIPLVKKPTIIIGRVGAYCGNVRMVNVPVWITDNAIYIKEFKTRELNLHFLLMLMKYMKFSNYADYSGQPKITQKPLETLIYIVPPLELQNRFAAFVERVDQQKQTIQQSLEKLELMKKVLMQEYFG